MPAPRIPYAYVTPEHYLLDLVYNPPLTQFLDYGRQRRGAYSERADNVRRAGPKPRGASGMLKAEL